jgi:GDP-L-fucose synthase
MINNLKEKAVRALRKLLDVSKIHALGWNHSTELKEGITKTYEWYRDQLST